MSFSGETRALFRLGAPMVATQFFIMGMGFLDTAMAGHYAAQDLGGVSLGGMVLWPVFMLTSGFTMAITPIVAQLRGADRIAAVGPVVRQGLWIGLASSAVVIGAVLNAAPLFRWAGVDPGAADVAVRYLDAVAWGVPGVMLYVTLRYASEGLGQTVPPMVIVAIALALNGVLNYGLIYGKWGLPELGGEGCGWATAIVMWFELALMVVLLRWPYFRATAITARFEGPRLQEILAILKVGAPIGMTAFLNMTVFSVISFLIGSLGVAPLAAHSIAGNVNWATFVIPMGLGSAASIRVGYFVGSRDFDRARHVARTAFLLTLGYAVIVSALLLLGRHLVVAIYTDDPTVARIAATLIVFIALYQLVDDTKETMAGALRGYKDTRVPMVYSLIGYWVIALPIGAWLGFGGKGVEPMGVYGFWTGMVVGLTIVAALIGQRLWTTSRDDRRILRLALT